VRVAYGAQISLLAGVVAATVAVFVGVVVGLTAGYFGGATDSFLARAMDVVLAFPFLLFAIAVVSIVGPSLRLAIGIIAFFSWAAVGRVVRGQTLSIKEKEYVEARDRSARAICGSCSWTSSRTSSRRCSST
jgi:ABC-type dipeptide/oligopeptide/nickel transport system permease subunit